MYAVKIKRFILPSQAILIKSCFSFFIAIFQSSKRFIEIVNELRRQRHAGPISWNAAVKFLMARKFDVRRAVALYDAHEVSPDMFFIRYFPSPIYFRLIRYAFSSENKNKGGIN